jgi:hypothetical protein
LHDWTATALPLPAGEVQPRPPPTARR